MPGHQLPACLHETPIGSYCERCGSIVGISGPEKIERGQIWRARSHPYGKIAVLKVNEGIVTWVQGDGQPSAHESVFRNEFWYWGTPEDTPLMKEFEALVGPFVEKIANATDFDDREDAKWALNKAIGEFEKKHGVRPTLDILFTKPEPTVRVIWSNEAILKKVVKR